MSTMGDLPVLQVCPIGKHIDSEPVIQEEIPMGFSVEVEVMFLLGGIGVGLWANLLARRKMVLPQFLIGVALFSFGILGPILHDILRR